MGSSVCYDAVILKKTGQSILSEDMTAAALISQYDCDFPLMENVLALWMKREW